MGNDEPPDLTPEEKQCMALSGTVAIVDEDEPNAEEVKKTLERNGIRAVIANPRMSAALIIASLANKGLLEDTRKVINVVDDMPRLSNLRNVARDMDSLLEGACLSSRANDYKPGFEKPHRHKGGHKANARKSKKR